MRIYSYYPEDFYEDEGFDNNGTVWHREDEVWYKQIAFADSPQGIDRADVNVISVKTLFTMPEKQGQFIKYSKNPRSGVVSHNSIYRLYPSDCHGIEKCDKCGKNTLYRPMWCEEIYNDNDMGENYFPNFCTECVEILFLKDLI